MEVHIDEMVSTVHAVDSEALVSPAVLRQIIQHVMRSVRDEHDHAQRVRNEQRVNAGRVESSSWDGDSD